MAASSTSTLANEYQKYFSKKLLKHAIQLTKLDQFAYKADLPKNTGSRIISFFRRSASAVSTTTGLVSNVQTLTEGVPISTFIDATLLRVDVTLTQYGEATKITDILQMTELFNALKQNTDLMGEDCALNADSITRNALVTAATTGITQNLASGTSTEFLPVQYAQNLANLTALNTASVSGGKVTAADFIRAATRNKLARATGWGGYFVALICPQIAYDMQNDPDWIDASNFGDPQARFKGELKTYAGCRFVEHTNPMITDASSGALGTYAGTASAANAAYWSFVIGQQVYGCPAIAGDSPYDPSIIIVDRADSGNPLKQFMTAGWKNFWAASALNPQFGTALISKSEYAA